MAVFTRVNGDSQAVVNVGDDITKNANSQIISTGIATPIDAFRVEFTGNARAELGTDGLVEKALRTISGNATVLAYQIDPSTGVAGDLGASLSVIVERSSWTGNAEIQTAIQTIGGGMASALVFDRGLKLSRQ